MKGINDSNFSINIRTELMGISILMIFIYHLVLFYERYSMKGLPLIDDITGKWYVGVDIFFFLSAYGLCQSLENNNYMTFYKRRIMRIFPMYMYFFAILYIVLSFLSSVNFFHFFCHALFHASGLSVFRILNSEIEWFVPSLIVIYILFPVLYKIVSWLITKFKTKAEVVIILLSIFIAISFSKILYINFSYRIPIILVSILFYYNRNSIEHCLKLSLFAFICSFFTCREVLSTSLLIPVLMLCLCMLNLNFKNYSKALSFCGKHSLEIYLSQVVATKYIMSFCLNGRGVAIAIITTILFSILLYYMHKYLNPVSLFNR